MMFFSKTVRIVVKNQNLAIEAKTGSNLYQVLVAERAIPATLCKGNGQCGKCKVHIQQRNPSKPNKKEQLVLAKINLEAGFRLACQTTIKDDMVVDTSEIAASSMPLDMQVRPVSKVEQAEATEPKPETTTEAAEPVDQDLPTEPTKPLTIPEVIAKEPYSITDGLLLSQNKGQLRYFLYSAGIDGISQEGVIENATSLTPYVENGMLSDYIHDVLKIKQIDRLMILSDEHTSNGENFFDVVSYTPFDIGAMPCEFLRPQPGVPDLTLFLRLLSIKGRKRLFIPLDSLRHSYYFADDGIVRIPNNMQNLPESLFDIAPAGKNPVTELSDDLKNITTLKPFVAPDSVTLQTLIKTAGLLVKNKLADSELRIHARNKLDKSVPLEYVVKVVNLDGQSAFSLFRDKEATLIITQDMMNALVQVKKFIQFAIDHTESNLGNIEEIIISTPTPVQGLLDSILALPMVPKRHQNITVHNSADSTVKAVKLFHEQDLRTYIQNHIGTYTGAEA